MLYQNKEWMLKQIRLDNSIADIARECNVDYGTITYWEKKHGIKIPRHYGSKRKTSLDEAFFSIIDTQEKAYILGFIMADGWINKDKALHIRIKSCDIQLLERIRLELNSDTKLLSKNNGSQTEVIFSSKRLVGDLMLLGVIPNKTKVLEFPTYIPDDLMNHFIRGYWDGGGYVGNQCTLTVGSNYFYSGFMNFIDKKFHKTLWSQLKNGNYRINLNRRDYEIVHWIYKDSSICLERKYTSYIKHWCNIS